MRPKGVTCVVNVCKIKIEGKNTPRKGLLFCGQ